MGSIFSTYPGVDAKLDGYGGLLAADYKTIRETYCGHCAGKRAKCFHTKTGQVGIVDPRKLRPNCMNCRSNRINCCGHPVDAQMVNSWDGYLFSPCYIISTLRSTPGHRHLLCPTPAEIRNREHYQSPHTISDLEACYNDVGSSQRRECSPGVGLRQGSHHIGDTLR